MLIPIVNENDEIIHHIERGEVTARDIYRVSSLWLKNPQGEILLARRALTKAHSPGKWGPAVSGTLEQGESYEDNIRKEIHEEIGLSEVAITPGPKILVQADWTFFVQWYLGLSDRPANEFVIQKEEVIKVQWFRPEDLRMIIRDTPEVLVPSMKYWPKEFLS